MLGQNFDSVLYQNSPFVPPVTVQSAFNIQAMVQDDDCHPTVAIAKELRELFGEHLQFLEVQNDWLVEKFAISQDELDDYYFGLLVPVTLMIAADLSRYYPTENILNIYFPLSDEQFFIDLRNYGARHLPLVDGLLHLDSPDPMSSATPVYEHCGFEVFSMNYWYQVGLEAGLRTFQQFAQLF